MGLFSKKEPREITEDDGLLTRLWLNPRTHAMVILGFYAVFFTVLLILLKTAGSIETEKENIKGNILSKSFTTYIEGKDISYNFVVTNNEDTYYFQGDKKNLENDITGTLMHNGEATNIIYNEEVCTVITDDENILCPEAIEYKYFDLNNIYEQIKDVDTSSFKHNQYFIFEIDKDKKIKVYLDDEKNIEKILINDGSSEYDFKYQFTNPTEVVENNKNTNNEV